MKRAALVLAIGVAAVLLLLRSCEDTVEPPAEPPEQETWQPMPVLPVMTPQDHPVRRVAIPEPTPRARPACPGARCPAPDSTPEPERPALPAPSVDPAPSMPRHQRLIAPVAASPRPVERSVERPTRTSRVTLGISGTDVDLGTIRHDAFGSVHLHPMAALSLTVVRSSRFRLAANVGWWPDVVSMGSAFGGQTIRMHYLRYGGLARLDIPIQHPDVTLVGGLGVGAETIRFAERAAASDWLPSYSTSPTGTVELGLRLRPLFGGVPVSVRAGVRALLTHSEIFDPTGIEAGRELTVSQAVTLGVSLTPRALR